MPPFPSRGRDGEGPPARRRRPPRSAAARARERAARRRSLRAKRLGAAALACVAVAAVIVLALRGSRSHAVAGTRARVSHVLTAAKGRRAANAPAASAGQLARSPQMRRLIALGRPIYCAPPHGHELALTFDDGPGPYTRLVLAKLHKHHVAATFFVVGRNIPLVPGAIRDEAAVGAVGDHTFTHPLLTAISPAEAETEIVHTQRALEQASGGPVALFRPPYGGHDATVDRIAREHGLLEILWDVDSRDSLGASWSQIERTVIAGMRPGAIILMHENHGQTVRALLGIFAALQRRHLRTVSVTQLLNDDPPSDAQVRSGGADCGLAGGLHGD